MAEADFKPRPSRFTTFAQPSRRQPAALAVWVAALLVEATLPSRPAPFAWRSFQGSGAKLVPPQLPASAETGASSAEATMSSLSIGSLRYKRSHQRGEEDRYRSRMLGDSLAGIL